LRRGGGVSVSGTSEGEVRTDAVALLRSMPDLDLEQFAVVGNCLRFDERGRNDLKVFRQRLAESFYSHSPLPTNFLLWGVPGSGKSYLVQQVAKSLPPEVRYHELNLAQLDSTMLRSALERFVAAPGPGLCFVDEMDARSDQSWPYEDLLPYLEPATPRGYPTVFCLAGSGGQGLKELTERIRARPKGPDLLSRIPQGNAFAVNGLGIEDKILVSVVQLLLAAKDEGHTVREIEKLALFYLAVHPAFASARQLRHRASQCAGRIPPTEDRIRYDYLFRAGDSENKQFWTDAGPWRAELEDSFLRVRPGSLLERGPVGARAVPSPPGPLESSTPSPPRIAVLPLVNISADPSDRYFAEGLTEEMIGTLSKLRGLDVISRTSVMQYRDRTQSVGEIGRELNVGTVLEGSVRKSGNRVRIAVQLIDAAGDKHLWGENYDRTLEDVFEIQGEIAEMVASALQIRLRDETRATIGKALTQDTRAHTLYLKGRSHRHRAAEEALMTALGYFEQAVRRDPDFALAYAAMSETYHYIGFFEIIPSDEAYGRAVEFGQRAVRIDDSLAPAHLALAEASFDSGDSSAGSTHLRRALELDPSSSEAHLLAARWLLFFRRFEEVGVETQRALALDPMSPFTMTRAGVWLMYSGETERAAQLFQRVLELDPGSAFALGNLGLCHVREGRIDEGIEEMKKGLDFPGGSGLSSSSDLIYGLTRAGRIEEARQTLDELLRYHAEHGSGATSIAAGYASLGDREKTLAWLETALQERSGYLVTIPIDFAFDEIRPDPRFQSVVERLGFGRSVSIL
jgi:adenylate cyclase